MRAAFHVWHMNVLLYAVFKDRERPLEATIRSILLEELLPARSRARALKAEQYSPVTSVPLLADRLASTCEK
jgi:hypothetical protein